MFNIQLVSVVVRLFAVWQITWGIRNLPAFWIFDISNVTIEQRIYTLAVAILMMAIGVYFWLFPLVIANKLISSQSSSELPNLNVKQFYKVGVSLIGISVLTDAIPNGGYALVALSLRSSPLDSSAYATIVRLIITIVMGFWLVFGTHKILEK